MEFESFIDTVDCSKDHVDIKIADICERTMKDLFKNWSNHLVVICGDSKDPIREKSLGMKGNITNKAYLYHIMKRLIYFKQKQPKKFSKVKYEFYFCCYEVMTVCDNSHIQCDEEINDLVCLGSSNISLAQSDNETSKSESDMQEICIDSDSLEELVMVIDDIVCKRKMYLNSDVTYKKPNVVTVSHLVTKIRVVKIDKNSSDSSECEIVVFDICELNEPLDNIQKMFESLESNENSLSIDTRICQLIFEKLRKCNRFNLISFISSKVVMNQPKFIVGTNSNKRIQIKLHNSGNSDEDSEERKAYF